MKDEEKSKSELIEELTELRRRMNALEASADRWNHPALPLAKSIGNSRVSVNGYYNIESENLATSEEPFPTEIATALRELRRETLERRQIEAALRQSEEEYGSLINNLNMGVYRTSANRQGRFLQANPAIAEIFGYDSLDEFMKVTVSDLYLYPGDRKEFVDEVMVNGYVKGKELLLKKRDGTPIWTSCTATVKYDEKGKMKWIDGIIEDITQRRQAEEALRENEFKFHSLFDLSPQAIALVDFVTARILEVNDRFCKLFKFSQEEIIGKTPIELGLYSKENRGRFVKELMVSGEVQGLAMDFVTKSGPKINTLMFAKLVQFKGDTYILTIFHDFTEQKRLEAQFQQAQRIEAIGTLAGGIAHDFNNLLMAIQGNVSLLRVKCEENLTLDERLKTIEQYIQNGSELTRQLLGFARGGKYEVKSVDLNELVLKSSRMFGRTKKEIKIHRDLQPDLWTVNVDQGQIEQVALNLYVNAWQAMPGGGDLYLKTENIVLDESFVRPFKVQPGKYVKFYILDTGVGMDKKTLQRIFDPFYTTKEMSRGTGLGLASAYGIIKNHDGIIEVYSRPGQGARFEIYLPVFNKKISAPDDVSEHESVEIGEALRGNETILLVDDEDVIIEVTDQMLANLGYRVLTARNGQEALQVYARCENRIDIVVLDLIMPGMSGSQTYDRLKRLDPDARVLFCSGYSVDVQAAAIFEGGVDGFIQKPFGAVKLTRKIREILEREHRQTQPESDVL
jgi:PAS domain S-box-containing protein